MAKAKKRRVVTKIAPISDLMRHINKTSIGADSSVVVGEVIPNPAYRESAHDVYLGVVIDRMMVWPKFTAPCGNGTLLATQWTTQMQTGNQVGTPAVMDIDNEFLFAHGNRTSRSSTAVGFGLAEFFPIPLDVVKAIPIIVTPEFSIIHDAGVNNAEFQSKEIVTIIEYTIVEVPDHLFTQMLMNQSRTS